MSPIETTGPLVTTSELARILDRHPGTIKNHARKYKIGTPLGRTRVYTERDVEAMREIVTRPSGPKKKDP